MKTILRNLFYTLKRFRTASVLNLLGLSTAFAAFILIMMKASYEYSFDTCYPNPDRLVGLNLGEEKDNSIMALPRGPIDFLIEQIPGIEYGTIYAPCWQKQAFCTNPESPQYFYETPWAVYPDFAKVIGLQFVEGSDKDMNKPESIIISESYARKLFPKGNALGSYLYTEGDNGLVKGIDKFRICGIFKDLPENCQFKNDMFIRMSDYQKDDWASQNYFAFFRLKPGVSAADINQQIEASGANKRLNIVDKGNQRLYVFPIKKLYYDMSASYYLKTGDRSTMVLIVSIGLLIIIIACINLINFSTALAPVRIRSINTQKVLGSSNWELRRALLTRPDKLARITGHCRNTHTPEGTFFYGIHPFTDYLLAHHRVYRNHCTGNRYHCRTLSVMVHDFVLSCPRAERELCAKRKRQTAPHVTYRFPIHHFICADCNCRIHFSAKPLYAKLYIRH